MALTHTQPLLERYRQLMPPDDTLKREVVRHIYNSTKIRVRSRDITFINSTVYITAPYKQRRKLQRHKNTINTKICSLHNNTLPVKELIVR